MCRAWVEDTTGVTVRLRRQVILLVRFTHTLAQGTLMQTAKSFCCFAFAIAALAGSGASALIAQAAPARPWTITATFTGLRTGGSSGVVYGPELAIRRDFGPRWGVQLRASLPVLETEQYTDDGAAALDLGPTLKFATEKAEFGLSAGATAFLVGDRGELVDGGIGVFVGGRATTWLSKAIGVVAGADVRISGGGHVYPSLSGGLTARF
jgi:hypothetical protein